MRTYNFTGAAGTAEVFVDEGQVKTACPMAAARDPKRVPCVWLIKKVLARRRHRSYEHDRKPETGDFTLNVAYGPLILGHVTILLTQVALAGSERKRAVSTTVDKIRGI